MLSGSITALITPFRDGQVDEDALHALVERQIEAGTHGLVPCGTTGESPTLSRDEHLRVVEICIDAAAGRVPIIAGTGSNSTQEALDFTRHAEQAGAAAALVVTPYYNKPTQAGLIAHFSALNAAVEKLPLIIYNIPGRSLVDMQVDTMAELAALENIVGVKDATGDLARVAAQRIACGLILFSFRVRMPPPWGSTRKAGAGVFRLPRMLHRICARRFKMPASPEIWKPRWHCKTS